MGILFQSKASFIFLYVVSLLLFMDIHSIFNVYCICGISLLHRCRSMGKRVSMVATFKMMWYLVDLITRLAVLALQWCASISIFYLAVFFIFTKF